jgi:hypothetical protein
MICKSLCRSWPAASRDGAYLPLVPGPIRVRSSGRLTFHIGTTMRKMRYIVIIAADSGEANEKCAEGGCSLRRAGGVPRPHRPAARDGRPVRRLGLSTFSSITSPASRCRYALVHRRQRASLTGWGRRARPAASPMATEVERRPFCLDRAQGGRGFEAFCQKLRRLRRTRGQAGSVARPQGGAAVAEKAYRREYRRR